MEQTTPFYTIIFHNVRRKFNLTLTEYIVIDLIRVLSTSRRELEWCIASKNQMAEWLGISRRKVFNAINKGIELGLIEKYEDTGYIRTTTLWNMEVQGSRDFYDGVQNNTDGAESALGDVQNDTGSAKNAPDECTKCTGVVQKMHSTGAKNAPNNNIDNNKDNNKINNLYKEENKNFNHSKENKKLEHLKGSAPASERSASKEPSVDEETFEDLHFFFKQQIGLDYLYGDEAWNKRYCGLCLQKFGSAEQVKRIIELASQSEFWRNRITSFKDLFYNGEKIFNEYEKETGELELLYKYTQEKLEEIRNPSPLRAKLKDKFK